MTCHPRDMSPTLPAVIRARRKQVGLTIEALAFASKVSVATVQRLETGKHDPTLTTLGRIAEQLDTTSEALLAEAGRDAGAVTA